MRYRYFLLAIFFFGSLIATAQDDDSNGKPVTIKPNDVKMKKVSNTVYMLQGKGGNIGFSAGEDGVFMIDDQFANATPDILMRIRSVSKLPIRILVNTHHHGDHTGGNSNIKKEGTTIFAHDNARKNMIKPAIKKHREALDKAIADLGGLPELTSAKSKEQYTEVENSARAQVGSVESYIKDPKGLPVITFSDDMTFHFNGEKIFVFHVHNAHTNGDAVVYFTESNVIHTGDVLFNGRYPYIDASSGGSIEGYLDGLKRILMVANDQTKVIPGHGDLASIKDVQYSYDMIEYLWKQVAVQYVGKKSEQEILQMNLTETFDAKGYGSGFISTEKFIKFLYQEAAKKYKR